MVKVFSTVLPRRLVERRDAPRPGRRDRPEARLAGPEPLPLRRLPRLAQLRAQPHELVPAAVGDARNAHCGSGSVLRPAARWASTALSGRSVESGSGGRSPAHRRRRARRRRRRRQPRRRRRRRRRPHRQVPAALGRARLQPAQLPHRARPAPSCCGGRTRAAGSGRGRARRRQRPPHRDRRRPHDRRRRREQRRLRRCGKYTSTTARRRVTTRPSAVAKLASTSSTSCGRHGARTASAAESREAAAIRAG